MRAVVYEGPRRVGVHDVDDAVIEDPTDVAVRVSSSAICGTDLHMYDGRTGAEPGMVIGHEPLGVVVQVGEAVSLVRRGERVVMSFPSDRGGSVYAAWSSWSCGRAAAS